MAKNRNAIDKRRQAKKARKNAERRRPPARQHSSSASAGTHSFLPAATRDQAAAEFAAGDPVVVEREDIMRVARQVSDGPMGLAFLRPEPWAEPRWCMHNVREKVELDGGRARYGWTFNIRRGPAGPYITLAHHAVWNTPDGKLVDVTPLDPDPRVHPVMEDGHTLILVDFNAEPVATRIGPAPLPSRSFPMTNSPELAHYVAEWNERERRDMAERYASANAMTVDPAALDPRCDPRG
jgi:hypothetical protein